MIVNDKCRNCEGDNMKKIIFLIILIVSIISILHDCGKRTNPDPVKLDFSQENYGDVDPQGMKLAHGEILSITQSGDIVIVKAKIPENITNDMIIKENYYNVEKLITKNGFNTANEIKYLAVMDMSGNEIKVISFDLDKSTIDGIYAERILGSQIGDYAKNLWIAPALK